MAHLSASHSEEYWDIHHIENLQEEIFTVQFIVQERSPKKTYPVLIYCGSNMRFASSYVQVFNLTCFYSKWLTPQSRNLTKLWRGHKCWNLACIDNELTTSPWIKELALYVIQSHPLYRTCFRQYITSLNSCAVVTRRWGPLSHAQAVTAVNH